MFMSVNFGSGLAPNSVFSSAPPVVADQASALSITTGTLSSDRGYTWKLRPLLASPPGKAMLVSGSPKLNSTQGSPNTSCSAPALRMAPVIRE